MNKEQDSILDTVTVRFDDQDSFTIPSTSIYAYFSGITRNITVQNNEVLRAHPVLGNEDMLCNLEDVEELRKQYAQAEIFPPDLFNGLLAENVWLIIDIDTLKKIYCGQKTTAFDRITSNNDIVSIELNYYMLGHEDKSYTKKINVPWDQYTPQKRNSDNPFEKINVLKGTHSYQTDRLNILINSVLSKTSNEGAEEHDEEN